MKKERENMNKLKVNMNYKTGRRGENNCRIVSAGSELDKMYQQCYDDYMKVQEWNERKRPMQQEPKRDGSGEWILS
mgnify:FL=1|tara:strand:+ start:195 stop:422 length:228 start_codon:yes stop_codon:yes gene_type:complete